MSAIADLPGAVDPRAAIQAKVQAAGTSFYWAMRLLPVERRDAMFAIYAFCREVDDIADSDDPPEEKRRGLLAWREEIAAIYEHRSGSALGRILSDAVDRYALRRQDFIAMIEGMEMDAARDIQAPPMAELDLYCARVASAVGHLSVRIFGSDIPAADRVAEELGRALQLTNILRDIDEDAQRGRLYLPEELLRKAGIGATEPHAVLGHPALPQVCEELARVADAHYTRAREAMRECPRKAMRPAAVMCAVYHAVLDRLRERGWRDLAQPVSLPKPVKLWLALRHGFF